MLSLRKATAQVTSDFRPATSVIIVFKKFVKLCSNFTADTLSWI